MIYAQNAEDAVL